MNRIQRATAGLFAAWRVQHAGVPSRRSVPAAIGILQDPSPATISPPTSSPRTSLTYRGERMNRNVHERVLDAPPGVVGALIDGLASDGDALWPSDRWPAMRLDCPLRRLEATQRGRMRIAWPLIFRWLHDPLIEEALDRAETAIRGAPVRRRRWSPWVRLLRAALRAGRRLAGRLQDRSRPPPGSAPCPPP